MSIDIVEIALDRFTDWVTFEKLALEVIRDEGYADVRPLGGVHDEGVDAIIERSYVSNATKLTVIVQVSLQKEVPAKVRATLKRLEETKQTYQKLLYVTSTPVSTETQRDLRREAKKSYGVDLDFIERKTLVLRLSDPRSTMLARFFPDLRKQVDAVLRQARPVGPLDQGEMQKELLKMCCAFTFSPTAIRSRSSLLDALVLAIMTIHPTQPKKPEDLIPLARNSLGFELLVDRAQAAAALKRLEGVRYVTRAEGAYTVTTEGLARMEGGAIQAAQAQRSFIQDVVDRVAKVEPTLDSRTARQLENNARDVMIQFFRLHGTELARQVETDRPPIFVFGDAEVSLAEVAQQGLPAHLGRLLFMAIGESVADPARMHAKYLAGYARAYVALAVMNLDPALRELQTTRLASKTFVFDTDCVLRLLIDDHPLCEAYRKLVAKLLRLGCRVLVTDEVLNEVVTHLDISTRTYHYFGDALSRMGPEIATARIGNALVFGWWARLRTGVHNSADEFERYRARYLGGENRALYVRELLSEIVPNLTFGSVAEVLSVHLDEVQLKQVVEVLLEEVTGPSWKNRSEEQLEKLAQVDASIFLAISAHNSQELPPSKAVLGQKAYVITESGRYVRVAQRLVSSAKISTRPQSLMAIVDLVGSDTIDDSEFVALFNNPMLQQCVQACWEDIKVLLDTGIEFEGQSLTRLRHDLEARLHDEITRFSKSDAEDESEIVNQFTKLVESSKALGYKTNAMLDKLSTSNKSKDEIIGQLSQENAALRAALDEFGKKKAKFAKKQAERSKRKP